jgi:hypothetical protein
MCWDACGEQGHPVPTTASEVGPLLLARMLNLNDIQEAVLTVAFRVVDDSVLLLLDLDDLRAIPGIVAEKAAETITVPPQRRNLLIPEGLREMRHQWAEAPPEEGTCTGWCMPMEGTQAGAWHTRVADWLGISARK